jgi:arylsulfatase A-like enzyme
MLRLTALTTAAAAAGVSRTKGQTAADPGAPAAKRPNILMIVADDHRHDALGAMGDGSVISPCLDQLAAQGTAFTQAHHMGGKFPAVCVPTRGSLLTGCSTYRAMTDLQDNIIQPNRVTLGEHLGANGYYTQIVGKWHNDFKSLNRTFAHGDSIFLRGLASNQYKLRVHHYDPTGVYGKNTVFYAPKFSTDYLSDRAVDFLQNYQEDQPFFLYTAFTAPHDPRTPPQEAAKLYRPDGLALPANFAANHPFDNGELKIRDEDLAPHPRKPDRVRRELAGYYGMVSNLDAGIGRILAALEASGQAENTIVIYTGDHGLALGQHGLMGKQNLYEHSLRVPLLMRGPGVPANRRSDALIYSWDLFPTLCDLTGVPVPAGLDAQSLTPVLKGETQVHRAQIHALYRDFQRMVKNDRWKLIEYAVGTERHTQLFDLQNDRWEMHNRTDDPTAAAPLAALRSELRQWQTAVGDEAWLAKVAAS